MRNPDWGYSHELGCVAFCVGATIVAIMVVAGLLCAAGLA